MAATCISGNRSSFQDCVIFKMSRPTRFTFCKKSFAEPANLNGWTIGVVIRGNINLNPCRITHRLSKGRISKCESNETKLKPDFHYDLTRTRSFTVGGAADSELLALTVFGAACSISWSDR